MPLGLIKDALEEELKGKHFRLTIDLGCGGGENATIIRPHTDFLIGADITPEYIERCNSLGLYDELFLIKAQDMVVPRNCDSVVMTEVLEHMPHEDGETILQTFSAVPFMAISTPRYLFPVDVPYANYGQHVSLWTEQELQQYGFKTRILFRVFYPQIIWGVRKTN